jgi:hypothetical protein
MHIDKLYPSRFLRCADLNGQPLRVTIAALKREDIGGEQKNVLAFTNGTKPLVLNKTNGKTIAKVLDENETTKWPGRDIVLVPAQVDFRGDIVDAVRVRAATPKPPPQQSPDVDGGMPSEGDLNDDLTTV